MATKTNTTQVQETNSNMDLYNKVRAVPDHAKKSFNNGSFSGTDINPMWRIRILTEQFGPCGIGWYTEILEHWEEEIQGEILTNVSINLYVKMNGEWSKPIFGIGGNKALQQFRDKKKISDEAYKMAYTDAISVAAKALGIGADVYFEKDSTSKYAQYYSGAQATQVQEQAPQPQQQQQQQAPRYTPEQAIADIQSAKTVEELGQKWNAWAPYFSTNASVVKAVMQHPCNPNNGRSTK